MIKEYNQVFPCNSIPLLLTSNEWSKGTCTQHAESNIIASDYSKLSQSKDLNGKYNKKLLATWKQLPACRFHIRQVISMTVDLQYQWNWFRLQPNSSHFTWFESIITFILLQSVSSTIQIREHIHSKSNMHTDVIRGRSCRYDHGDRSSLQALAVPCTLQYQSNANSGY